jgi:radical SAM superfamily enzyme YgiQ (UPF0313 family)
VKVVLISPYDLGRQPFALAEPAALLERAGFSVSCLDLSLERLEAIDWRDAALVAIHLGMHTATRIALEALPRIRAAAPGARLCAYGLYAPMNAALLRSHGVTDVIGGEFEPGLLAAALGAAPAVSLVYRGKVDFAVPQRAHLPALSRYARLILPDGAERTVGFAEASRGCKHLCRHCPVVPVYEGRFRAVPAEIVLADVRQQVAQGAQHIAFGDPDFLNGPTHALRIARALHAEFPALTWDATIKIQHLVDHAALLPEFKRCGCLFITSAVEAVDERILEHLAKNHTCADFERAVALLRAADIALAPTFVAFTPWTTLEGYCALLETLARLDLVENVPPVQLTIRLLVPEGSHLLKLARFHELLEPFDARLLGYPWRHRDPRVDRLHEALQDFVARAETQAAPRREVFAAIWRMAHAVLGRIAPPPAISGANRPIPRLSEPWYCCSEPTNQQLAAF